MTLAENQAKADAKRMRDRKRKAKWRASIKGEGRSASIKGVASQPKADFPPGTKFDLKTKEGRSAYNRARYKKQKADRTWTLPADAANA